MIMNFVQYVCLIGLLFISFMFGWAVGYREGRQQQTEILLRLRKQIADNQSR